MGALSTHGDTTRSREGWKRKDRIGIVSCKSHDQVFKVRFPCMRDTARSREDWKWKDHMGIVSRESHDQIFRFQFPYVRKATRYFWFSKGFLYVLDTIMFPLIRESSTLLHGPLVLNFVIKYRVGFCFHSNPPLCEWEPICTWAWESILSSHIRTVFYKGLQDHH